MQSWARSTPADSFAMRSAAFGCGGRSVRQALNEPLNDRGGKMTAVTSAADEPKIVSWFLKRS